jgi:acyl carrier protein
VKTRIQSDVHQFIVVTWLSGDERGFQDDTDLYQAGILDSFAMLVLVGFLEDRFKVALEPPDMTPATFRSVETVAQLIVQKLEGSSVTAVASTNLATA